MRVWLPDRAVALVLAALTLAATIAAGALPDGPSPAVRAGVGLGVHGRPLLERPWSLVTSVLVAGSLPELIAALVAIVVVVGFCERHLGHRRTAAALLVSAVLGGLLGTGLESAGVLARGLWTTPPATDVVLHPETPVLGVLLTASAFAGPLWRRRIRFLGFTGLIVLLLYSGQPEDLDHLAGAVVGLVLGVASTRKRPRRSFPRSSHTEARGLLAALIAIAAVGPIVAVIQPTGYGLLRPLGRLFRDTLPSTAGFHHRCDGVPRGTACLHASQLMQLNGPGTVLLDVLPLVLLLVAAAAVLRGRRVGAWLAVAVNGLLGLFGALYYGLLPTLQDPDQLADVRSAVTLQSALAVAVPAGIATAAFLWRRHCAVLPSRRSLRAAAAALGCTALALVAVQVGVGEAVRTQFTPHADPLTLLLQLPERLVPVGFLRFRRLALVPIGPEARLLFDWIGATAWLAVLAVTVALASRRTAAATARQRARLRALLRSGAAGSISWMTTWAGNRIWFTDDGEHAVAYREGVGVALTVGEPVGAPRGAVEAARAFAVHCGDIGLVPAFYAVRSSFAEQLSDGGPPWSTVEIGEDTVLDPSTYSLVGKHWQDVRSSINRADREGVHAIWTDWASLSLGRRAQIESISEEWVADRRLPELGFTLGGLRELSDKQVRLMLAIGPGDRIEAVTSWLPTWEEGELAGLTLDFMRRRSGSMNGVVEFLIASVLGIAQQHGLRFVSLSVAPLAGADGDSDDRLQRVLSAIARLLEPAYGFRSLAAFKRKFRPEHRAMVLAYPDGAALPAISLAIARAYLPDRAITAGLRRSSVPEDPTRIAAGAPLEPIGADATSGAHAPRRIPGGGW